MAALNDSETLPLQLNGSEPEPEPKAKKKSVLTQALQVKALDLFRSSTTVIDGVLIHYEGWSDERVRDVVLPGANVKVFTEYRKNHVGKTRKELDRKPPGYGPRAVARKKESESTASLQAQVNALSERVLDLEAWRHGQQSRMP